ncbi:hypothetical protein, partial [Salinivibrio socompensis]|uniref:hypothetical protein n=1 Tax=Salinivibrio socompensis TaxID=1510206 RepID=UPI0005634FA4
SINWILDVSFFSIFKEFKASFLSSILVFLFCLLFYEVLFDSYVRLMLSILVGGAIIMINVFNLAKTIKDV